MEGTYVQNATFLLGQKLQQLSKLPDATLGKELVHAMKEFRDILITVGARKRKVVSPEALAARKAARDKKVKKGK